MRSSSEPRSTPTARPAARRRCRRLPGSREVVGACPDARHGATCLEPPLALVENSQQVSRGAGPVGVFRLPLVAELRDGSLLPRRQEDRVVAEPLAAARFFRDPALEDAGAAQLLAVRRKGNKFADVAGTATVAFDALELVEQAPNRVAAAEARRADPGRAVEALDLESGILAEHPAVVEEVEAVASLFQRVREVRRAVLGRVTVRVQQLEAPLAEHACQLAQLVLVRRSKLDDA